MLRRGRDKCGGCAEQGPEPKAADTARRPGTDAVLFFCAVFVPAVLCCCLFYVTVLYAAVPPLLVLAAVGAWAAASPRASAPATAWRAMWRLGSGGARAAMGAYVVLVGGLVLATLLFVLSPFVFPHHGFVAARLGAVTSTSIRVWARAPGAARFSVRVRPVAGAAAAAKAAAWDGEGAAASFGAPLEEEADHSGVAVLAGLTAGTPYDYSVAFFGRESGAPAPAPIGGQFTTLSPELAPATVRLAFGSCVMKSQAAGYELSGLSRLLELEPRPALWLMLGDLIYADVPLSGIGLGADIGLYRAHYRRTLADRHAVALERAVPGFYMIDDHEIRNDWKEHEGDTFGAALRVWREYAGKLNPPPGPANHSARPAAAKQGEGTKQQGEWYTFVAAHVCVFVADTRTQRAAGTILGETQLAAAVAWLRATGDAGAAQSVGGGGGGGGGRSGRGCTFKVFASPVPMTRNYANNAGAHGEGWGTYDADRGAVLDAAQAWRQNATHGGGVLFVSGDTHMLGVYELRPGLIEAVATPFSATAVPMRVVRGSEDRVVWEQQTYGGARGEQLGVLDAAADGRALSVSLYSKEVGFAEPEIRFNITRAGWQLAGGAAAASVVPGRPFARTNGSVLRELLLGYGATGLVLLLAGIAACVVGAPCCAAPKRRAALGVRRAMATNLGRVVAESLVRRKRVGALGAGATTSVNDGATDSARDLPDDDEPNQTLVSASVMQQHQPQRVACT